MKSFFEERQAGVHGQLLYDTYSTYQPAAVHKILRYWKDLDLRNFYEEEGDDDIYDTWRTTERKASIQRDYTHRILKLSV